MKNLSIAIKYSIPTMTLALVLIITVITNSILTSSMEERANTFPKDFMPAINVILNGDRDLYQARVAEISIVYGEPSELESLVDDFNENAQQTFDRFNMFREHMTHYPSVISTLSDFDKLYKQWRQSANKSIELRQAGNSQQAILHAKNESLTKFSNLREIFNTAGELSFEKSSIMQNEIRSKNLSAQRIMWTAVVIIMLAVGAFVVLGQKAMLARITELTERISEIRSGGGDLTKKIDIKHQDELGELANQFNGFLSTLKQLVAGISNDASTLNSTSSKLDASADSTACIVTQQIEATGTIAHSVNEMALATKELTQIAQSTADETLKAIDSTNKGVSVVGESVNQIDLLFISVEDASKSAKKLAEESTNISNVLDVIRGVAEQTNLLALNAAIEAARAGEQGRGFAVVADEVRALASKTQESTENIQNMIQGLQRGVKEVVTLIADGFEKATSSVELFRKTQDILLDCSAIVNSINQMSIQTAAATEQQSVVTDGINTNLQTLNDQTKLTQTEADNTKSASSNIIAMANSISKGVSQFKI